MARKPFVVIDAEILSSSVWSEAAHVRLVWLTLLILCDTDGYVGAAVPGIARAAGVTLEEAQAALAVLQQPDPHSRTKADEGRRLREVERGWRVLNFRAHLDRLSKERAKSRERVRRHREKKRVSNADVTPVTPPVTPGSREQGTGNREQNGRTEAAPALPPPPEQRAEEETKRTVLSLQIRLAELLTKLTEHPNSRQTLTAWCREVTSYEKPDGTAVKGRPDYRTVTGIDHLEKSISDAVWWLEELDRGKVVGSPELVRAANGTR